MSFVALATAQGTQQGDMFGYAIATGAFAAGDLVVGAPHAGSADEGKVYLVSAATGAIQRTITGSNAGEMFGWSVAAGDLNGAGNVDFVVGAPSYDNYRGRSYLYFDDPNPSHLTSDLADVVLNGRDKADGLSQGDKYGYSVAIPGDVDDDADGDVNNDEILIGAYGYNNAQGQVHFIRATDDFSDLLEVHYASISGVKYAFAISTKYFYIYNVTDGEYPDLVGFIQAATAATDEFHHMIVNAANGYAYIMNDTGAAMNIDVVRFQNLGLTTQSISWSPSVVNTQNDNTTPEDYFMVATPNMQALLITEFDGTDYFVQTYDIGTDASAPAAGGAYQTATTTDPIVYLSAYDNRRIYTVQQNAANDIVHLVDLNDLATENAVLNLVAGSVVNMAIGGNYLYALTANTIVTQYDLQDAVTPFIPTATGKSFDVTTETAASTTHYLTASDYMVYLSVQRGAPEDHQIWAVNFSGATAALDGYFDLETTAAAAHEALFFSRDNSILYVTGASRWRILDASNAANITETTKVTKFINGFYLNGENAGDQFGRIVSSAGDTDGDGTADYMIAAPNFGTTRGKVYLYQITAAPADNAAGLGTATESYIGENAGDFFGSALAYSATGTASISGGAGNDASLVFSAPNWNLNTGKVYVMYSAAFGGGLNQAITTAIAANADGTTLVGENTGDLFGSSIAVGNISGISARADLIVSAPGYNTNRGKMYFYLNGLVADFHAWNTTNAGWETLGNRNDTFTFYNNLTDNGTAGLPVADYYMSWPPSIANTATAPITWNYAVGLTPSATYWTGTANAANPNNVQYKTAGQYDVSLTITENTDGETGGAENAMVTLTKTDYIFINSALASEAYYYRPPNGDWETTPLTSGRNVALGGQIKYVGVLRPTADAYPYYWSVTSPNFNPTGTTATQATGYAAATVDSIAFALANLVTDATSSTFEYVITLGAGVGTSKRSGHSGDSQSMQGAIRTTDGEAITVKFGGVSPLTGSAAITLNVEDWDGLNESVISEVNLYENTFASEINDVTNETKEDLLTIGVKTSINYPNVNGNINVVVKDFATDSTLTTTTARQMATNEWRSYQNSGAPSANENIKTVDLSTLGLTTPVWLKVQPVITDLDVTSVINNNITYKKLLYYKDTDTPDDPPNDDTNVWFANGATGAKYTSGTSIPDDALVYIKYAPAMANKWVRVLSDMDPYNGLLIQLTGDSIRVNLGISTSSSTKTIAYAVDGTDETGANPYPGWVEDGFTDSINRIYLTPVEPGLYDDPNRDNTGFGGVDNSLAGADVGSYAGQISYLSVAKEALAGDFNLLAPSNDSRDTSIYPKLRWQPFDSRSQAHITHYEVFYVERALAVDFQTTVDNLRTDLNTHITNDPADIITTDTFAYPAIDLRVDRVYAWTVRAVSGDNVEWAQNWDGTLVNLHNTFCSGPNNTANNFYVFSTFNGDLTANPAMIYPLIDGPVANNRTLNANNPYFFVDTPSVNAGVTLTIPANTACYFGSNVTLTVNGNLRIEGTNAQHVTLQYIGSHPSFAAAAWGHPAIGSAGDRWYGIVFPDNPSVARESIVPADCFTSGSVDGPDYLWDPANTDRTGSCIVYADYQRVDKPVTTDDPIFVSHNTFSSVKEGLEVSNDANEAYVLDNTMVVANFHADAANVTAIKGGAYVYGNTIGTIADSSAVNINGRGIYTTTPNAIVLSNVVGNVTGDAITCAGEVGDNRVMYNYGNAIVGGANIHNNIVMENNGNAILAAANGVVSYNQIERNGGYAILNGAQIYENSIVNNNATNGLANIATTLVASTTVTKFDNNTIRNNKVTGTANMLVDVTLTSDNENSFRENEISDNISDNYLVKVTSAKNVAMLDNVTSANTGKQAVYYLNLTAGTTNFYRNSIIDNIGESLVGGAIYVQAAHALNIYNSDIVRNKCKDTDVTDGTGTKGAGIYVNAGTVVINGNTITFNFADHYPGIYAASGSNVSIVDNTIAGNEVYDLSNSNYFKHAVYANPTSLADNSLYRNSNDFSAVPSYDPDAFVPWPNNISWDFRYTGTSEFIAPNNYWGTNYDLSLIEYGIYDDEESIANADSPLIGQVVYDQMQTTVPMTMAEVLELRSMNNGGATQDINNEGIVLDNYGFVQASASGINDKVGELGRIRVRNLNDATRAALDNVLVWEEKALTNEINGDVSRFRGFFKVTSNPTEVHPYKAIIYAQVGDVIRAESIDNPNVHVDMQVIAGGLFMNDVRMAEDEQKVVNVWDYSRVPMNKQYTVTVEGGTHITAQIEDTFKIRLIPQANWSGAEDFTVRLTSTDGTVSYSDNMRAVVDAVNDLPMSNQPFELVSANSLSEDFGQVQIDLNRFFTDPENDAIVYSVETNNAEVKATIVDNMLTLESVENWNSGWQGYTTLHITAADVVSSGARKNRASNETTVDYHLNIKPVNDAPVLVDAIVSGATEDNGEISIKDGTLGFKVDAFDIDSALNYQWTISWAKNGLTPITILRADSISFTFADRDIYNVKVEISDGEYTITKEYRVFKDMPAYSCALGNYPNPFNPSTKISFYLKNDSPVKIEIFNMKGQKVRTISDDFKSGIQNVEWNGKTDANKTAASGMYLYRVSAKGLNTVKKMTLLK